MSTEVEAEGTEILREYIAAYEIAGYHIQWWTGARVQMVRPRQFSSRVALLSFTPGPLLALVLGMPQAIVLGILGPVLYIFHYLAQRDRIILLNSEELLRRPVSELEELRAGIQASKRRQERSLALASLAMAVVFNLGFVWLALTHGCAICRICTGTFGLLLLATGMVSAVRQASHERPGASFEAPRRSGRG